MFFRRAYLVCNFVSSKHFKNASNVLKINVNLHKYKYIALDVLNEFEDYEKVKKVVEYYFTTSKTGHPIEWMLKNFYEILESYDEDIKDKAIRKERRKELAKIREEWLNGNA
jgi:hypothetical protein